ncbi:glycosyltransferase family 39 protein [Psychroserpens ponticola]|uniref:Glycosyltransferase family 39 protein n=1 Tax=Psychroserpens ponticola TaxID=2932268 RepID=A0ABY7S0J0_9FLAO|nr:glycosyltransferase family 39 protein [Psychroserpens ponticola]WCO02522.1 glycosyltransferase family 39 protein [Psychroserpens ponticola]
MSIKKVYLFYCILFVVLGFTALNFNYIEGDDAQTVLHHVFGRDASFQPPYSPYHSMFDTVLSAVSTQNEASLRIFSIVFTFTFSLLVLLFIAKIVNEVFEEKKKNVSWFLLMMPFVIPEMLFSGLIINPTNISFALVLLSHIFLIKYLKNNKLLFLIIAILLFGFGVSFRWISGFYIFVLFGHFIFSNSSSIKTLISIDKLKKSLIVFPFFIVSVLLWIQISGYSIFDIYDVFVHGTKYLEGKETSLLSIGATAISFTTPALVVLLILGTIHCVREKLLFPLALLLISILPYFTMGIIPMYKYMVTTVLPIVIVSAYGFVSIKRQSFKYVLFAVIVIPWFIGFQIESNTAWGPGFEVRSITNNNINEINFNPDKSTSINDINIVVGSGMAMPTSEGPRPLFGFGKVLLKDWCRFVANNNIERESSVNYAIDNNCNILQDVNHSFMASKLCEIGYYTEDKFNKISQFGVHRTFYRARDSVSIDVFKNKNALFDSQLMNSYLSTSKKNKIVIYSTYTNIMTKLQSKYKNQFKQKGAFWGILTLND